MPDSEAKSRFLDAIGHRPVDHKPCQPLGPDFDWRKYPQGEQRERALRRLATAAGPRERCQWWWCATPGPREIARSQRTYRGAGAGQVARNGNHAHERISDATWEVLFTAATLLKAGGRDVEGSEAGAIIGAYHGKKLWAAQADPIEALYRHIESFTAPARSDAAVLRNQFLARVEPLRLRALDAQGRKKEAGQRLDRATEAALETAEALNWSHREVAAIFLLTGLEQSVRLEYLSEKLRNADKRRKARISQQKE